MTIASCSHSSRKTHVFKERISPRHHPPLILYFCLSVCLTNVTYDCISKRTKKEPAGTRQAGTPLSGFPTTPNTRPARPSHQGSWSREGHALQGEHERSATQSRNGCSAWGQTWTPRGFVLGGVQRARPGEVPAGPGPTAVLGGSASRRGPGDLSQDFQDHERRVLHFTSRERRGSAPGE